MNPIDIFGYKYRSKKPLQSLPVEKESVTSKPDSLSEEYLVNQFNKKFPRPRLYSYHEVQQQYTNEDKNKFTRAEKDGFTFGGRKRRTRKRQYKNKSYK